MRSYNFAWNCISVGTRPQKGFNNTVADAWFRRVCPSTFGRHELCRFHASLCHPGIIRMLYFSPTRNLPSKKWKTWNLGVRFPQSFANHHAPLVKATQPSERLTIDFKEPLPSFKPNMHSLTIIDEFSLAPFASFSLVFLHALLFTISVFFCHFWHSCLHTFRSRHFFHIRKAMRNSPREWYSC